MRKLSFLFVVAALAAPAVAHAQHTARFQLSLEPSMGGSFLGSQNGLEIIAPEGGNTQTLFGLASEFGFLATPLLEPGLGLNLFLFSDNGTAVDFGFTPFLKLNLWSTQHVNPFFQPFTGFVIVNPAGNGGSTTFFDGGMFAGVELLVTNWGFRVYSGFEALVGGGTHSFGIPIRWAFTVYF